MVGLREERGGHKCHNDVCACQFQGCFAFSLFRGALWWEKDRVQGIKGVRCLATAVARGSCVLTIPFAIGWNNPGAFLS